MVIVYILAAIGGLWFLNKCLAFWQFHRTMNEAGLSPQEKDVAFVLYPVYSTLVSRSGPQVLYEMSLALRSCRGLLTPDWYIGVRHGLIQPSAALEMVVTISAEDPAYKELKQIMW